MIDINLLPKVERKRVEIKWLSLLAIILFIGALVLFAFVYIGKTSEVTSKKKELQQVKDRVTIIEEQIAELKVIAEKVQALDEEHKKLEEQKKVLNEFLSTRLVWSDIIANITSLIPQDKVWLTNLSLRKDDIRIQGIALENKDVAQMMVNLKASPYLSDVDLQEVSKAEIGNNVVREFIIVSSAIEAPAGREIVVSPPERAQEGGGGPEE